jgi:hypothetical protein
MYSLFGTPGLADAALFSAFMIGCCGLLLLFVVAAIGFFARSRIAATTGILLGLLQACMFTPWAAFKPIRSDHPDMGWARNWQIFAYLCAFAMLVTLAAGVRAFGFSSARDKPSVQESGLPPEGSVRTESPAVRSRTPSNLAPRFLLLRLAVFCMLLFLLTLLAMLALGR